MTSSELTVVAVIPAYNEAATVGSVVRSLAPYVRQVIVVDDCSTDETGNAARAAGATVVTHASNQGYDAAMNTGFAEAASLGADIILTFDADGEHDATDLPKILAPLTDGTADIVLGQRPGSRHWGETLLALYTRLRFGIPDPLCGMKAYRREVYERAGAFDTFGSIGTELALQGCRSGFRITLVPITLHARPKGDRSRFYAMDLRGNLRMVRALWCILRI